MRASYRSITSQTTPSRNKRETRLKINLVRCRSISPLLMPQIASSRVSAGVTRHVGRSSQIFTIIKQIRKKTPSQIMWRGFIEAGLCYPSGYNVVDPASRQSPVFGNLVPPINGSE